MSKVFSILSNKSRLIFTIANSLILYIIPLFYGVRYYNTDDVIRRQILTGSVQFNQDSNLIFSASYVGKVFTTLYNVFPALEWYLIINSLLIIFSLQILLFGVLQNNWKKNVFISLFFLMFMILVGRDIITNIHFTLVSSLLAVTSGFVLSRNYFANSSIGTRNLILSFILLSIGISFRVQSALLAFAFTYLSFVSHNYLLEKDKLKLVFKRYTLISAVMFVVSFCPSFISKISENSSYKKFRVAFSNHRALFDFKIHDRVKNAESTFKNVGWEEGHKQIFFTYMLPAVSVFSPANLDVLVKSIGPSSSFRLPDDGEVKFLLNRYAMGIDYKLPFFLMLLIPMCIAMKNFRKSFLWLTISLFLYLLVIMILGVFLKFPGEYVTTPLLCGIFYVALANIFKLQKHVYFIMVFEIFVIYVVARNHQTQSLQYLKNLFKGAEEPIAVELTKTTNLVCLSQRSNDYVFPFQYNNKDWWRKADLERAYYFGPFIWHPANKVSYRKDSSDLLFNSLNSNQYSWILANGYENDFIYDGFDEAVIKYVKDQYNVECKFEIKEHTANYTLYKLVSNNDYKGSK